MPELYLTPSSISNLTQFLLTFIITVYLVQRAIGREKKFSLRQDGFLLLFFISICLLSLLFFLDNSFLPTDRFPLSFVQLVTVNILLVALIQFAYDFPTPGRNYRIERWIVLLFSFYCLYFATQTAVHRFDRLQQDGWVVFLGPDSYVLMGIQFALVVSIFTRNAIRDWKLPASRNFALILLFPLALVAVSYNRGFNPLITFWYPIVSAIGLLFTIFFFTLNYLSSQPERISFVVKISGAVLTSVLAVFGLIAWLVAQPYADRYVSPIQQLDHRTLRFSPDGKGGYTVSEISFQWEENYGQVVDRWQHDIDEINFNFPFFGKPYSKIYLSNFCSIGMEYYYWGNFQYRFTSTPMIMPLLVDLDEINLQGGNYYVSQDRDRLIFTCYNLASQYHPEAHYTIQTILFSNGSFNFSYNGLPQLRYYVDDFPDKTAWAIGIKPAAAPPGTADFTHLPMQVSPQGALQDEYRAFRIYLHKFLLPLAIAVIVSSFAFLIGTAVILNYGLARPLKALLEGVQNFNKGQRETAIPIPSNDEIGYLTESFNQVGGELNDLIQSLEQRVSERTQELSIANAQLHSEMEARAVAQAQVMEQQRAVAALEERERVARELHDGIGQVLGFLNVQAQSADDSVRAGEQEAASQLLRRMAEVAQEAHDDVRGYILGLKKESPQAQPNFIALLEQYRLHMEQSFDFRVRLNLPCEIPSPLAAGAVETQLLYVIREALSNARSHSGQKEAEVTLTFEARRVQAVIEDRGAGFAEAGRSGHFGLGIMRERAEGVGGSLEIESTPGCGTRVTVCLPRQLGAESTPGRRILLVDDHPLFIEGMANLLSGRGLTVVGVANDGLEAQEKARELHPDVILMDIEMPRCDGLEATRRIKAEMPEVKVVMLTVSGEERHLFEALLSGASGYLLKSLDAAELTTLLDELLRGEISLSPSLANKMLEAFTRHKSPPAQPPGVRPEKEPPPEDLSARQMETLRLVAQGLSYKEVAAQLSVAEVTVKYRMGEILTRLHLNSKREAVRYFRDGKVNQ
jgi:DNA-binding NarL/FixJ family response regulator/signal transduction histidine kinase